MSNLHSHAFQRAFAGATEQRGPGDDSFWTWREVMYAFVGRITPEQLHAIAGWLYVEMLKSGYTAVGEFHYLHHDPVGVPYADAAEMSHRIVDAASRAGIATTLLPVLYTSGGFGDVPVQSGQRRFVHEVDAYARLLDTLFAEHGRKPEVRIGIAPHSLRAVPPVHLERALAMLDAHDDTAPVHLHIAEQAQEVIDCLTWSGARPVDWLLDHQPVDGRWCLVHATHLTERETAALAATDAVVGLCPTTEANLGDGIFPALEFLAAGGRFGIGSDSHVSVSPVEELRLLEYGQRLVHQRRALLAEREGESVGERLYRQAARDGAQALGREAGTLAVGRHADLLVLDPDTASLVGRPASQALDAMIFSPGESPVRDVMVAGQWRVRDRTHVHEPEIFADFRAAMTALWSSERH